MADDDNFDIDIYGDDSGQNYQDSAAHQSAAQSDAAMHTDSHVNDSTDAAGDIKFEDAEPQDKAANGEPALENGTQQISSTGASANNQAFQKQAPQQQGTKRK